MGIQGLGRKFLTLLQHKLIEVGQHGRVKTNGIFYQENHLHAHLIHIMFQIHLILYQFNDRKQQVGISQPTEHILKDAQVFVLHTLGNTVREGSQHHQWNIFIPFLNASGNIEHVAVIRSGHTDNKVERHVGKPLPSLFFGGYLCKTGRITETQIHVFIKNLFVYTSVIFQHEGIVGIGYKQHIEDSFGH